MKYVQTKRWLKKDNDIDFIQTDLPNLTLNFL